MFFLLLLVINLYLLINDGLPKSFRLAAAQCSDMENENENENEKENEKLAGNANRVACQ